MADDERRALVVQGPRSLAEVGAGARNILSSVMSDALTVASAREKALVAARFRVRNYDFCEPDYCQIMIWAEALEIDPEILVQKFEKFCFTYVGFPNAYHRFPKVAFVVEQGAIVSLAWDVTALPLKKFDWVPGLTIRDFAFFGEDAEHRDLLLQLPTLRLLIIQGIKLTNLDLSRVPSLTKLWCDKNQLTELLTARYGMTR